MQAEIPILTSTFMEGAIIHPFLCHGEKNPQGVRDTPQRPVRSFTDMRKYFLDTDIEQFFKYTSHI